MKTPTWAPTALISALLGLLLILTPATASAVPAVQDTTATSSVGSDPGSATLTTPDTTTKKTVDVGGTWDPTSSFLRFLIAPFYLNGDENVKVQYPATGFDPGNGVSYEQSIQAGSNATAAAIQEATKNGTPVGVNSFSQGADAAGDGVRSAITSGVDPNLIFLNAVASPDMPGGLRSKLPFDLPGFPKGTNGNTGGAPTRWSCLGHELVCNPPSDLSLIKWLNSASEYWLEHGANGPCNYATPQNCNGQTIVKQQGNQTTVWMSTEAGLVQMADNAKLPLPEPIKVIIRTIVADGDPVYQPQQPAPAPTLPIKVVMQPSEVFASDPASAPVAAPDPVVAAHDFVNDAHLDEGATVALNNAVDVVAGLFGR